MPQAVFLGCAIVVRFARVSTTQSLKFCPLRCRVRSVPPTGTVPSGFGGVGARMTSCCMNKVTSVNMNCCVRISSGHQKHAFLKKTSMKIVKSYFLIPKHISKLQITKLHVFRYFLIWKFFLDYEKNVGDGTVPMKIPSLNFYRKFLLFEFLYIWNCRWRYSSYENILRCSRTNLAKAWGGGWKGGRAPFLPCRLQCRVTSAGPFERRITLTFGTYFDNV